MQSRLPYISGTESVCVWTDLLNHLLLKERNIGVHPGHIDVDLQTRANPVIFPHRSLKCQAGERGGAIPFCYRNAKRRKVLFTRHTCLNVSLCKVSDRMW